MAAQKNKQPGAQVNPMCAEELSTMNVSTIEGHGHGSLEVWCLEHH